jgi:hypothetical protein
MIKYVGAVLVISTLIVPAVLRSASDVSGTWDLEMRWAGPTETITSAGVCRLEQRGDTLSGTCGSGADTFPVAGRIEGNQLSWRVDVTQGGSAGRMEFAGELDERGTTIRGACHIVGGQDGSFTMKKQP